MRIVIDREMCMDPDPMMSHEASPLDLRRRADRWRGFPSF
jgi:hypothetical protein